jgi:hypothetical protein
MDSLNDIVLIGTGVNSLGRSMKSPCSRYIERLVSLAEGHPDPAAEVHVAACEACADALAQYQGILVSARREAFPVPAAVLAAAKAIMPSSRRTVLARLVRSSALAGARALPGDLQVALEADGRPVRVMYTRRDAGWEVLGTLPGPDWRAEREAGAVHMGQDGRFSFSAPRVEATGFRLASEELAVEIPPLEELLDGSTGAH